MTSAIVVSVLPSPIECASSAPIPSRPARSDAHETATLSKRNRAPPGGTAVGEVAVWGVVAGAVGLVAGVVVEGGGVGTGETRAVVSARS